MLSGKLRLQSRGPLSAVSEQMTVVYVPRASPHAKQNIDVTTYYVLYLYINAIGAVHSDSF
jgi:hypothetical protein